jgi:anaerobic magnesium-protoporphyrin IX monomethyl ester cyclase
MRIRTAGFFKDQIHSCSLISFYIRQYDKSKKRYCNSLIVNPIPKMKVVLLNSCFFSERKDYLQNTASHIRIGIASIASFLRNQAIDVAVLDPQIERLSLEDITQKILSFRPDYVGLPAYTEEIKDAARIAEAVKAKNSDVIMIVGGPHASAIPQDTLKEFNCFDIAVIGEGELTMRDILTGKKKKEIKGIVYRDGNGQIVTTLPQDSYVDLDSLPLPAWDLYKLAHYAFISVDTLRGCPYPCIFCFRATGKKVRYRSPQKIVDDIAYAHKRFGFINFSLTGGGTFPLERGHGLSVCEEILKRRLKIKWETSLRCDLVDEELLRSMKASGCQEVALGIESISPEVLKLIKKETTPEQIEAAIRLFKKVGIAVELNFILGLPYETRGHLVLTRHFLGRLAKYVEKVNLAILTPFPGTDVYEMALNKRAGLEIKTKDWSKYVKQGGLAIKHQNFEENELVRYQFQLYLLMCVRFPLKVLRVFSFKRAMGLLRKGLTLIR